MHSYRHTRRAIRAALGVDVEQLFDQFDPQPLASGSIAQVHKAILRPAAYRRYLQHRQQQEGLAPTQHPSQQQQDEDDDEEVQSVVVKVCHPNVAEHIRLDFKLVGWLSAAASQLPLLRGLPLRESVAQFSHTMTAQTDLRVEAVHALRFYNNFAGAAVQQHAGAGAGVLSARRSPRTSPHPCTGTTTLPHSLRPHVAPRHTPTHLTCMHLCHHLQHQPLALSCQS